MTHEIPQAILDALTNVDMPRLDPNPSFSDYVPVGDYKIPRYRSDCVIIGSGAAGLRAAVEVKRRGCDVAIVTQSAWGGTSACSGSDKQTLHTANTSDQGDDYLAMARAIRAGGAMDEDSAYIEAVGSSRALASLQYLGLPLPQNVLGGTLRYQTDHDEVGRATSCGPRTSRLMVKVLADEALRLSIPFFNHTIGVRILTSQRTDCLANEDKGQSQRGTQSRKSGQILGMLAIRAQDRSDDNPFGMVLFQCPDLVLAAGGPGELYRDSTFPNGCYGSLGMALEAGAELVNLTENQFGIGTRREGFPWNLSGTYVQAIPHVYSVDAAGKEHHFLADYYRTTAELASNLFRKGYQWPFHATRLLDFGSSLIDLAVYNENKAGRRVFMDFNRNPLNVPGSEPFSLDGLNEDVKSYLQNVNADQNLPIDRLRHMNPLAIELYRCYKIDIATAPLEFSVNHQHMNGGVAVDIWGQSNVPGLYAIGEAAGTHGVTRPGGSALNAGQVFGTRAAEHIAGKSKADRISELDISASLAQAIDLIQALLQPDSAFSIQSIRADVQARMSEKAGFICNPNEVEAALAEARMLNEGIRANGIALARDSEIARLLQWQQMAIASEAVIGALDFYIRSGGGSRGARAICDAQGEVLPSSNRGPLVDYRFREEKSEHQQEQIVVRLDGAHLRISTQTNRSFDERTRFFFERDWPDWLTGRIYNQ